MSVLNTLNAPLTALTAPSAAGGNEICPIAPEGAVKPIDELTGYGLFALAVLFGAALLVSIGAILVGKFIGMSHMAKGGVLGLAVVFATVILYLVSPGMLDGMLGSACIPKPSSLT